MLQKIKFLSFTLSSFLVLALPMLMPSSAAAAAATNTDLQNSINGSACNGTNNNLSSGTDVKGCSGGDTSVQQLISSILNWMSVIVGVIAVIMIIVAGLRYVTSGGQEKGVKGAKDTILYAIIGLVIVAVAQIIVHFVLHTTSTAAGTTG